MAGASGTTTLGALPPFLLGAQGVWVRDELGIGLGVLGATVSLFFGSAAVGSLVMGAALDRLGRRRGLRLAGVLVAVGGVAMALGVRGPVTLLATAALLGLGNAACQTAANLSMARALPPHRRGLGFGVKQSAVPFAIMLGGLAVPTLGGTFGWRSTFLATAAVGLAVAASTLWRRSPVDGPAPVAGPEPLDRPPVRPLLMCGVAISFASAAANFLGAFVASWGYEVGLSASAAGLLMAAGSMGSITVRVISGWRADGRHGANLPVVAVQMLVGAVALAGLSVGTQATVVGFGLLAFSVGWAWPGLLLYAAARLGRDTPARASGVIQGGAFVGGAVGPLVFGAMAGQLGFRVTWLAAAGCFVVAAALVTWARVGFRNDLLARPPRTPVTYGGGRIRRAEP